MSNKKTQQERLKDIENAARKNNQTRLKELLQSFRVDLEQDLFEANPEETNKVLKEIETKSKQLELEPTTMSDIMEIRRLIDLLARGELEEDQFGGLPTSLINPNEKIQENNIGNSLVCDSFLGVIFETEIDENDKKEKVERINNLGFNVKSVEQLQKIVQEALREVFKVQIPIDEALDNATVIEITKSEADLEKLKTVLKTALPKEKEATLTPTPSDTRAEKKPPRPSPPRGEKPIYETATMPEKRIKELREKAAGGSATTTIPEENLNKPRNITKQKEPAPEPEPMPTLESLDNEIQKNPELEFIIHVLTGNIKAMGSKNIHITKEQLFDFLTKEELVSAFSDFVYNRKSAIQILLQQQEEDGGPYKPEKLDGFCDELKTQIKNYLKENPVTDSKSTKPVKDAKKPTSNDTAKPQGNAIETMHASSQGGNKTDKTTPQTEQADEPTKEKQEQVIKELDQKMIDMAHRIAPTASRKWRDLFNLLHSNNLPGDKKDRAKIVNKRKQLLGIQSANDHSQLISALQQTKLEKFMKAENPIDAFRKTFPGERLANENLKTKLNEKIDEIMAIIKKAKEKIKVQKKEISQKQLEKEAFRVIGKSVNAIINKKGKKQLLKKLKKYIEFLGQEKREINAPVKEIKTPDIENLTEIVEKNNTLQPLINDLEEVRKLLTKKETLIKIGLTPKGFKDLESFKNKEKELKADNDPLIRASSRQELIKEYLKIVIKSNPSLFKGWDDKKSPQKLVEILQDSWASFLDKLKK